MDVLTRRNTDGGIDQVTLTIVDVHTGITKSFIIKPEDSGIQISFRQRHEDAETEDAQIVVIPRNYNSIALS